MTSRPGASSTAPEKATMMPVEVMPCSVQYLLSARNHRTASARDEVTTIAFARPPRSPATLAEKCSATIAALSAIESGWPCAKAASALAPALVSRLGSSPALLTSL